MEGEAVIERVVTLALQSLQTMGFFECPPEVSVWRIRWKDDKLAELDFRAAATAEGNIPVLVLSSDIKVENDIDTLIHESIHLAQIMKGDLLPGPGNGTMLWKGKTHSVLPAGDGRYFLDQPWEAEAQKLFPALVKKMKEGSEAKHKT